MQLKIAGITFLSIAALLLGACAPLTAPPPSPAPAPAASGTLQVYVTDAPPRDEVTSIMTTISEVQVHRVSAEQEQEREEEATSSDNQTQEQSSSDNQTREESTSDNQTPQQEQEREQQGDSEWLSIDLSDNTTFDLLDIRGIEQFLGASQVAAGKYTQVRLVVDKIQVALGGGELQDAEVPSNTLKLVHPFEVKAGETTALTIDFDADRMVTVTGSGKILVKPVVKLFTRQKGKGEPQQTRERETEPERERAAEETEFQGSIVAIDGNRWTLTADNQTMTVDVSTAEIEGEPRAGLLAKVEGTVVNGTMVAREAEIKRAKNSGKGKG